MTTKEVAEAFTAMLKAGDHHGAADKFNAEDIASYEAMEGPMAVVKGRAAIKAKSDWWYANHEVHGGTVEGPLVNGNMFLVEFGLDVTMKATGQRMQMQETALYTVKDGKIVEERFFYAGA